MEEKTVRIGGTLYSVSIGVIYQELKKLENEEFTSETQDVLEELEDLGLIEGVIE